MGLYRMAVRYNARQDNTIQYTTVQYNTVTHITQNNNNILHEKLKKLKTNIINY